MSAGRITLLYFFKKDSTTIHLKKYDGHPYFTEVNGMFFCWLQWKLVLPQMSQKMQKWDNALKAKEKKKNVIMFFFTHCNQIL